RLRASIAIWRQNVYERDQTELMLSINELNTSGTHGIPAAVPVLDNLNLIIHRPVTLSAVLFRLALKQFLLDLVLAVVKRRNNLINCLAVHASHRRQSPITFPCREACGRVKQIGLYRELITLSIKVQREPGDKMSGSHCHFCFVVVKISSVHRLI